MRSRREREVVVGGEDKLRRRVWEGVADGSGGRELWKVVVVVGPGASP